MPQISKIRIVNCNYNDGNRLIPDELYDLSSSESGAALNSLFNLNNGGGKTVLVQLMMQPVNPKAMSGGRHIEDYFVRSGDHAYVLIEWNKDNSKDKLLTGISIAASQSASDDNSRGNSIKYYTFKTEYTDYSPYSIAALELSKNENGRFVPESFDYVREKAKVSKGALEYYSSDDSVKWASILADYGIYRSEWESVIETLNKDEGGLNQYFDDAKTSDKLISKFFIPAIEQKMRSVSSKGADGSLETMLINYARKISDKEAVIQERDTNRRLLDALRELGAMSEELYAINEQLVSSTTEGCGFKAALARRIAQLDQEFEAIDGRMNDLDNQIRHIEHEEKSKNYYLAHEKLELMQEEYEIAKSALEISRKKLDQIKHEEDLFQCAKLYKEIEESVGKITALKNQIAERENNSEDAEQIGILKYSTMIKVKEAKTEVQTILNEKEEQKAKSVAQKAELEKAKSEADSKLNQAEKNYNQVEARIEACKENTDRQIEKMELPVIRQFDGFYPETEIQEAQESKQQEKTKIEGKIVDVSESLADIEKELQSIPGQQAEIKIKIAEKEREKKEAEDTLRAYDDLFARISKLCEKHSIDISTIFSGRLSAVVKEDIELTEANITKNKSEIEGLNERLQAAKNGHVHVLPRIMEYISATGINCQTGEEYLCRLLDAGSISEDKVNEILEKYPEIAYAILFDDDKNMHKLLQAGNVDWIPAAVPLFTMGQVDSILKGEESSSSFLAVYDRGYFANRVGYLDKLDADIRESEALLHRFKNRLVESKVDSKLVEQFAYSEDFRDTQETKTSELMYEIDTLNHRLIELEGKKNSLLVDKQSRTEELETNRQLHRELNNWLEACADLIFMIDKEVSAYNELQNVYKAKSDAEKKCNKLSGEIVKKREVILELETAIESRKTLLREIDEILKRVDNAKESEVVEGEWRNLYSQYKVLCDSRNSSLEELRNTLEEEQHRKQNFEDELTGYSCEKAEYEATTFSVSRLQQVKSAHETANIERDKCQEVYTDCKSKCSVAENALESAKASLADFDGTVLPKNEIAADFKARIKEAKGLLKELSVEKKQQESKKGNAEKVSYQVSNYLDEESYVENYAVVELQDSLEDQWKLIRKKLIDSKETYSSKKNKLYQRIGETVNEYKPIVLSEIVGKLTVIANMLDDAGIKGDRLFTVSDSIDTMIQSIEKINSKIETDLKEIENDFNDIVDQCMNQGKRMYNDLRMIANSSRAHIFEGKPQTQMVKLDLPEEKEISEEASRVSIKSEIEHGANELKELLKNEAEIKVIQKRAKAIVGSKRMLHKYIRQESISVKVYKIDINIENSTYKRWEDTLTQNSGAEKFVIFFAVVLTLMNYTRSSAGIIDKNAKSVLVLDNPFGKITSAHLLKPMFDFAKHFNVQLICLSDINKSDVINCFDNVIKLVIKEQNLSNRAIMTHEGNERIEHGYYKIMNGQMSLF